MAALTFNDRNYVNFNYDGKLCYTEDNVLIYKLFIAPHIMKQEKIALKEYFSTFGEVDFIKVVTKRNDLVRNGSRKILRFAFLQYKSPESATKALLHFPHKFLNRTLKVSAADSWNQPINENSIEREEKNEINNNCVSILFVSDDCLYTLLEKVHLKNRILLARTDIRFKNVFKRLYRMKKNLVITKMDSITIMEMRYLMKMIGYYLESFSFSSSALYMRTQTLLNFAFQCCPNLRILKLNSLQFKFIDTFDTMSWPNLTHLELKSCLINNKMVESISNIKTIEYLDLSDNNLITGSHIEKMTNLKTLILQDCPIVTSKNFIKICENLQSLVALNICHCDELNEIALNAMVDNLILLEKLNLCSCYADDLGVIVNLPNLKHLVLFQKKNPTKLLFLKLYELEHKQLESLRIYNYNRSAIKDGIILNFKNLRDLELFYVHPMRKSFLKGLANLTNLRLLTLHNVKIKQEILLDYIWEAPYIELIDLKHFQNYKYNLIEELISILKNQKLRRAPLTIKLTGTNITENLEDDEQLIQNKNIIKLIINNETSSDNNMNSQTSIPINEIDQYIMLYGFLPSYKRSNDVFYIDSSDCDDD